MEFQMRNKTFISSMVGVAAAVAVAGSANAGVVDPFTTAEPFSTNSGDWLPISGALFNERDAVRRGSSGSIDNGNLIFTVASGFNFLGLNYQMSGGATNDLSSIAAMSIALSGLNTSGAATGIAFNLYMADETDKFLSTIQTLSADGVSTFNFASATVDAGFDLTKVKTMTLEITSVGGAGSVSGTLSNFSYTAVPAPGALALLGAAGLFGARRRRA
jgi:MYXO-CTERM domain-containing protein